MKKSQVGLEMIIAIGVLIFIAIIVVMSLDIFPVTHKNVQADTYSKSLASSDIGIENYIFTNDSHMTAKLKNNFDYPIKITSISINGEILSNPNLIIKPGKSDSITINHLPDAENKFYLSYNYVNLENNGLYSTSEEIPLVREVPKILPSYYGSEYGVVYKMDGSHPVAVFTDMGYIFLRGTLISNCNSQGDLPFTLYNSVGDTRISYIDDLGNLCVEGYSENQPSCSDGEFTGNFINNITLSINNSGYLCLKHTVIENYWD